MADNTFLNDYKTYKNIVSSNTDDDDLLNQILDGVQSYFEDEYSIYLESEDKDLYYSGNNNKYLVLPTKYLSLNSVTMDGSDVDLATLYVEDNLLWNTITYFTKGFGNIKVSAHLGFDSTSNIPKSLLEAFLILADKFYENAKQNGNSIDLYTDPVAGHMRIKDSLPKTYFTLLQPHIVYKLA
jgi:hypothetical protein